MRTRKTLADEARARTKQGSLRLARKQAVEQRKAAAEDRKLKARCKKWAKDSFPEAKKIISADAEKGSNSAYISIMHWGDASYPAWAKYQARFLTKLLEKEKLTVNLQSASVEPCGSDPMFHNTVYNLGLLVSW